MARSLLSIPKHFPFAFAVGYGGVKTLGADVMVQKFVEKRAELDKTRATVFLGFGLFQVGFVQYLLYVSIFRRLFPGAGAFSAKSMSDKLKDGPGMMNVGKQVIIDQFIYHPFFYFPVFYTCKELVLGESQGPLDTVEQALRKYIPNMSEDLQALWKLYVPVSIIQCSVVPMHLRVPFVATVGIVWCAILSSMRGSPKLSETAKDMKRGLEQLAQDGLPEKLKESFLQHAKGDGVDQKLFKLIMREVGIADSDGGVLSDETLASLFDSFDIDGNGVIDKTEFLTGLQILAGKGTPRERIRFMFEALDLDHDHYVTVEECNKVVRQLLSTRERLLRFPVNKDANMHVQIGASRKPEAPDFVMKRQNSNMGYKELRLRQIWEKHPDYYGQPLEVCISLQVSAITARMMNDAGGSEERMTLESFEAWIYKRSPHSVLLMDMFNVLASADS